MDSSIPAIDVDMAIARRHRAGDVLVLSDGGLRRAGMVAPAGWIAYLFEGASATRLGYQNQHLENVCSAFQAEVIYKLPPLPPTPSRVERVETFLKKKYKTAGFRHGF